MNESALLRQLRESARDLAFAGNAVLVGVSGGADSVALARGLIAIARELRIDVHAAHLDHQLRGEASEADARWLARLFESLPAPLTIGTSPIAELARAAGRGIEETARDERYRFLEETARKTGCPFIAVAHTADDQAETVLHHILRGTGLAGLSGMPAVRELDSGVRLVRPMLGLRRADVLAWLGELGQDFREDESNADETFTRNRLRRQVLPQLARDFNPQLIDALCRLGQQARETQAALSSCAADLLDRAIESETPRECHLKWQPLTGRPAHLVREILSELWKRRNWPRQRMTFEHWDRLAGILLAGGSADFPDGVRACRTGRTLTITHNREGP